MSPREELVEAVAEMLWREEYPDRSLEWDTWNNRSKWVRIARAVIPVVLEAAAARIDKERDRVRDRWNKQTTFIAFGQAAELTRKLWRP